MLKSSAMRTVWQENNPDSLEDICIRYILRHPSILFYAIDVSETEDSIHEHEFQVSETSKFKSKSVFLGFSFSSKDLMYHFPYHRSQIGRVENTFNTLLCKRKRIVKLS